MEKIKKEVETIMAESKVPEEYKTRLLMETT